MGLKEIRQDIDLIDSEILKLLNERMERALVVKRFKAEIEDRDREKEVLDRIRMSAKGLIKGAFIEKIYREIIRESKTLQQEDSKLIAFQGEHGAYGEVAAGEWDKSLVPMPCGEFAGVFEAVESGLYDYGIVPVENTLGGVVGQVNDLLINTKLNIVGAVELPIHHCLLALPGTDHRDIRAVCSHEQALAQCRGFLARNKLEPMPYYDTAGAAKMLFETRPKGCAVIADRLCAELYNLEIIKEDIEDLDRNMTRFLVLSSKPNKEGGDKCSIVFSTEHKAGTLFRVLDAFAGRDINLTRIESIPGNPGDYVFFLDFMGSGKDQRILEVLEEVKQITTGLRVMGCYEEKRIT
jgi:chorismate mutase / prephenate dehydratase